VAATKPHQLVHPDRGSLEGTPGLILEGQWKPCYTANGMRAVFALALVLSLAATYAVGLAQDTLSTLLAGDKAYLLLPPKFVSAGSGNGLTWSPDGRHLAVVRTPMPLKTSEMRAAMMTGTPPPDFESRMRVYVDVYDAEAEQTRQALELPGQTGVELGWMPEAGQLIVLATRYPVSQEGERTGPVYELHRYDTRTSRTMRLGLYQGSFFTVGMSFSPSRAVGLVWMVGQDGREEAVVVTANGASQPSKVAGGAGPYGAYIAWNPDGMTLKLGRRVEGPDGASKWQIYDFDPLTLTATLSADTRFTFQESKRFVAWSNVSTDVRVGVKDVEKLQTTVLMPVQAGETDKAAVLDAFVERVEISPDGSRVAYTHHGMTLVRDLVEIPRGMYEQMRDAAKRTTAMSNAKQVALAAIMFSADNDDRLPSNKEDTQKLLMPYLRNERVFDGFVYTFAGGFIQDVANPAGTELGHISMPGGRIVAYVDGHVKWVPDGETVR